VRNGIIRRSQNYNRDARRVFSRLAVSLTTADVIPEMRLGSVHPGNVEGNGVAGSNKFLAIDNKVHGRHSGQSDTTCTGNTSIISRRTHRRRRAAAAPDGRNSARRGYSRNQHGFWDASGSRMTAAKVGSESITTDTDE
jgi:hypothetical protein